MPFPGRHHVRTGFFIQPGDTYFLQQRLGPGGAIQANRGNRAARIGRLSCPGVRAAAVMSERFLLPSAGDTYFCWRNAGPRLRRPGGQPGGSSNLQIGRIIVFPLHRRRSAERFQHHSAR